MLSTGYAKEFRDRAVRLLAESRENHASETKALQGVAKDLGVAAESLRRWRAKADTAGTAGPGESGELRRLRRENARLRRANEILSSASALFASRLDPTRR
jgi:transposase